jgi:delta24-sterol reductase
MVMHTASTCTNQTSYLVNVGVWESQNYGKDFLGMQSLEQFVESNRKIEKKVTKVGGLKWLYACNYYHEEEFLGIYDKGEYDELRIK